MDVGWPAAAASRWGNLHLLFPSTTSKDGCDVSQAEGLWVARGGGQWWRQGAVLSRAASVSLVTGDKV